MDGRFIERGSILCRGNDSLQVKLSKTIQDNVYVLLNALEFMKKWAHHEISLTCSSFTCTIVYLHNPMIHIAELGASGQIRLNLR